MSALMQATQWFKQADTMTDRTQSTTHGETMPEPTAPGPSPETANKDTDAEKASSFNIDTEAVDDSPISPQDDKRVQRKVDRVVMTLAAAVYFMQYLDKRGLAFVSMLRYDKSGC